MNSNDSKIWLFSFADLAFLLLIAFTQASSIGKTPVKIGEMTIPKVVDNPDVASITQETESYQIRVHRPTIPESEPFQMVTLLTGDREILGKRLSALALRNSLSELKSQGKQRPIMLPDEFSLSKDMLMAMSIIEKVWSDANRVTVRRVRSLEEQIK
jgi:hypothetical protein